MKKITLLCLFMLVTLGLRAQETYEWGNVAIGGGGFVTGIITNPAEEGLVYARTDVGGAYRWDATAGKWIPLLDWVSEDDRGLQGVESLATDPQAPNNLYILAGTSYFSNGKSVILKSTDYGATFTTINVTSQFSAHGNGMGRDNGEKLIVDPNNSNIIYCGSRNNGLFKSTDAGLTWTQMSSLGVTTTPNENGISLVVADPASVSGGSTQTIFVGVSRTGNNFYRSNDGGATFTALTGAPTDLMPQRASLASDGNLYVNFDDGAGPHAHWAVPEPFTTGQVWKYNTTANTWTNVTPTGEAAHPYGGISVDPNNPQRIVLSTNNTWVLQQNNAYGDKIFLSTDGGTSWTDLISPGITLNTNGVSWIGNQSIHWAGSIEFDPFDSNKVYVVSGNGIFVNENIGTTPGTWNFQVNGLEETVPQDLVSIPNGPVVSVISDYDGFVHTDVTQYAPIHTPRMGSTTGLDYAALNTSKLVRVGTSMYYSNDMGVTWTQTAAISGANGQVALSADGSVILHCPDASTTTYRSTDNGATWTTVTGLGFNAKPAADPVNTNKFYAYNPSTGELSISTDAGATFTLAGNAGTGGGKLIRTVPGNEGHVWVPLYGGGLAHSTDGGATFTTLTGVSYCASVGFGKSFTTDGYPAIFIWGTVNGQIGVYRSIDMGASWLRTNDDAHQYGGPGNGEFVMGDMNVYGRVYMSTVGRGIVYGETDATGEVVLISAIEITPDGASLIQDQTLDLAVTITPNNASNQQVTWTTSNAAVASVDANGLITGLSTGTVTITATSADGSGISDSIQVTVDGDADGDGVLDSDDLCAGTPATDVVDVNGCSVFSLAADNFMITRSAETCRSSDNGKINISATASYNYTATLTADGVNVAQNFTTATEFGSLPAGTYNLCITLAEQPAYQSCYTVEVTQPEDISIYGRMAQDNGKYLLDLSGSSVYTVTVNDLVYTITESTFSADLQKGNNTITVKGATDCQGTFTKQLFIDSAFGVYPNPLTDDAVTISNINPEESVSIQLFAINGMLVYSQNIAAGNSENYIALPALQHGTYLLNVTSASDSKTFKIIR